MSVTFCPATMCPLFARDGSPWTGDKNHACEGTGCAWFDVEEGCQGAVASFDQIGELAERGSLLQLGPITARRRDQQKPRTYDCARAHECQWQIEADEHDHLCPPRYALSLGLDPKACAW